MNVMNILGLLAGLIVGFAVPSVIAYYIIQVLQVSDVIVCGAWFIFIFLLVSALIRWSIVTMVGDE